MFWYVHVRFRKLTICDYTVVRRARCRLGCERCGYNSHVGTNICARSRCYHGTMVVVVPDSHDTGNSSVESGLSVSHSVLCYVL